MLRRKMMVMAMAAAMIGTMTGSVSVYGQRQETAQPEKQNWQMQILTQAISRKRTVIKFTVHIKISTAGMTQLNAALMRQ